MGEPTGHDHGIDAPDEATARAEVDDLCQRFLTNPVIEDSVISVSAVPSEDGAA